MGLIGAAVIQADFRKARQLDFAGSASMIDERDRAHLGICVGRDTDGPASLDVAVQATELGPVGMELVPEFATGPTQRLKTDRPDPVVGQVADVAELAPAITGRILAPAGHIKSPPSAITGAGTGD